ncbi:leucine-rich repeat neuronal protein 1-like [Pseudomyrmex gracilis]|uniref:leucine-rich repeat neuronal protein 1-like n=1 Tax=Pseudomyrmex gracilis TaxID=219809 RepID=UPI000995174B|nr:leucine-rich repeat neuronal protein 1-like [Pseudomyrmex gracilis]
MWLKSLTFFAVFVSLVSPKTVMVDLSFRKLKKEDFFVKLQSQIKLQDVTDLNLRGNEFDSFLDCSTNLETLRTLDLSQNHLQRFFFLCKEEYNLQMLNVSYNKLEYIDDNALNDRVLKLKILDLSYNKLSIVNETMLYHLTILEYLSLASNPIGDGIHEGAFLNLQALKHLDLRNISAPYFSPKLFKTLTNLSFLDLSWNPINAIPLLPVNLRELDLSGTQVTSLKNLYLPQLQELWLNDMSNLTSFDLSDLENLTNLETLSMIGCRRLIQLSPGLQIGHVLPRLQRLSIKNCNIETLDQKLQELLNRVSVIELENNPWKCDCKLNWIDSSVNLTKNFSKNIRCYTPDRHHGKLLTEVPNYELQCEYDSSVLYSILWVCLSILLLSLIIATILFLFRHPTSSWSFKGRNQDSVSYKNVVESNTDLVRILTVSETHDRNEE